MRIFISYRRDDSADITGRLFDYLARRFGSKNVFRDVDDIPVGDPFPTVITEALSNCDVLLVIIGPQWVSKRLFDPGDYVRLEIEQGLSLPHVRVIPVLVNNAKMPGTDDLPASLYPLTELNAAKVRNDPDFRNDVDRLIQGITAHSKRRFNFNGVALIIILVLLGLIFTVFLSSQNSDQPETTDNPAANITNEPSATITIASPSAVASSPTRALTPGPTVTIGIPTATRAPTLTFDLSRTTQVPAITDSQSGLQFVQVDEGNGLFLVNNSAQHFPLSKLVVEANSLSFSANGWGISLLEPGQCVRAWRLEVAISEITDREWDILSNLAECDEMVGARRMLASREVFWDADYTVTVEDEIVECTAQSPDCIINIDLEVVSSELTRIPTINTPVPRSVLTETSESATEAFPEGREFRLLYDNDTFVFANMSRSNFQTISIGFEALLADGSVATLSDGNPIEAQGTEWSRFYPTLNAGNCISAEINGSGSWLRPDECRSYNSIFTTPRTSERTFWLPRDTIAITEFRVLYQGQEAARCPVHEGGSEPTICEVKLP